MSDNIKTEYIKGFFKVLGAIIGAIALIVAAVLQNKNSELNTKISSLEEQVKQLCEEKESSEDNGAQLEEENKSLKKQVNELLKENKELKERQNDEGSKATASNTAKSLKNDGTENISDEARDLLSICQPYESNKYEMADSITIMGVEYHGGFTLENTGSAYVKFNLEGKYHTLSFEVGQVDGTQKEEATYQIFLNNERKEIVNFPSDMVLTPFNYNVEGVTQLRIELDSFWRSGKYGFVNVRIQ